jgi:hypothetical protein
MISDNVILLCHIMLFYTIIVSPFINDYALKKIIIILLIFFTGQWLSNYGKCGLINIEKYFLKDNFKNGFVYRLIKPVICYKKNIFYRTYFEIVLIYIFILYYQLTKAGYDLNFINDLKEAYEIIIKKNIKN